MKKNQLHIGVFALMALFSCHSKNEQKEPPLNYTVTNPFLIDTAIVKDYVCQIKSIQNIELRAQEKGFLQKIYVDEGQMVNQGQILFSVNPQLYQADLLKAQAEGKTAQIELENAKTLVDKDIISKSEQSMARAKLQAANAEIAAAKAHLSFTQIRAPFSGTIDRIPKKQGSLVDEGDLLTTLSDNSSVYAYFNVSEPEYLNYQLHVADRGSNKVSLVLANGEVMPQQGEIQTIEGEFNNETGSIAFRAKFPNNGRLLRNGETGLVRMEVPLRNALLIPQKATYEIQDKKYVFVVDSNGVIHSKEITILGEMPDIYIVGSGITVKDKILIDGVQKVKENDTIGQKFVAPKTVIDNLQLKAD